MIQQNTESLVFASKEIGLTVNADKSKYEGWNFNLLEPEFYI